MEERTYTCQEVADMVKVKVNTVYKWINRGKVQATRNGFKRYVFTNDQLEAIKQKAFCTVGGCQNGERTDCKSNCN